MQDQQPSFNMPQGPDQREMVKKAVMGSDLNSVMEQINILSRRLRVLEERYTNLQRKALITDQNMLAGHKKINAEVKTTGEELVDLKRDMTGLKDTLMLVVKELQDCAKKDDVKVLEKYLSLWEPVKFVTQNQVEKIVQEMLDDRKPG